MRLVFYRVAYSILMNIRLLARLARLKWVCYNWLP